MNHSDKIKDIAKQVITNEKEAIEHLVNFVDDSFVRVVELILAGKGRIIVTGIGKSANIGMKIVSTMNSTGTPAVFMHAADAIHGDLGVIQKDDVIICISKSGNTPEIKVLVPLIKNTGNPLIAIVGNLESFLAKQADYVINSTVEREACPNNLAPTSSTTAQLVMGDALAMALLKCKGFTAEDFAKYHPGGALGKQLYMRVSDLYLSNETPKVSPDTFVRDLIMEITSKRLGCAAVIADDKLIGIVTDGDLRRMLQRSESVSHLQAKDIMNTTPSTVLENEFAVKALQQMKEKSITQLLVVDENGQYKGVIHLHDLIKEGII